MSDEAPAAWFERLYRQAAAGEAEIPWDRGGPNPYVAGWFAREGVEGRGRRALVVGCGLGDDAEHVAGLGFEVTAFDVAETAVRTARARHPGSAVRYRTADLTDPPAQWAGAWDLVVESLTVQSVPRSLRPLVTRHIAGFVAPGGTLLLLAGVLPDGVDEEDGPPWRLRRDEVDAFAAAGLTAADVERFTGDDGRTRWRAVFSRAAG
ncbi:class I SAM-dependent methyltransferase [Spirilliplanes yamanashiensis]|uniref:Methyltransferase type 12 n=1 Tax=Spirilliplanes yamanashiensis TaxID=42233 RepID=A0A8J3YCK1_9ACTN|nr:class I SAM-dependent methyltransferase [Spirilliplanes yamanashiensis]MDP9818937.1 SAM-dependent methyltransferase [Spirilliplanes yamanashiensis]GIJ05392.1 methyltransferase type 12 [Spirilliplanes yamanashiensis]